MFGQQLPIAFVDGVLLDDSSFVVLEHIVGHVSAELIKSSSVGGDFFDVFALVLNVDVLFPAFGLHCYLYDLKGGAYVGHMLYHLL